MPQICCITERRFDLYQVTSVCSPRQMQSWMEDQEMEDGEWDVTFPVQLVLAYPEEQQGTQREHGWVYAAPRYLVRSDKLIQSTACEDTAGQRRYRGLMSRSSAAARQVMLLPANTPQDSTFPPHVSYLRIKVLNDVHYPSILAILVTFVCIQISLYLLQIRQDAVEIKHAAYK